MISSSTDTDPPHTQICLEVWSGGAVLASAFVKIPPDRFEGPDRMRYVAMSVAKAAAEVFGQLDPEWADAPVREDSWLVPRS